jgi:chromosome partitioning protein
LDSERFPTEDGGKKERLTSRTPVAHGVTGCAARRKNGFERLVGTMQTNTVIAVVNEKGGTGKTTTAVSLTAALGELGQKVLLVDLDGQAASSRWLGVEEDDRLADALCDGKRFEPIRDLLPGVSLAPASGRLDSVSHKLRPTQGGQLRKVLSEMTEFDFILIDCPPSLSNRLIGNALLAATHVIVPVETSILALDGLKILLTTLEDVQEGFGHNIVLAGVLACRYDSRTRLSRMILNELRRALPGKVFQTVIRENVRIRECPASGQSILTFASDSHAAKDYRALAKELLAPPQAWREAPVSSEIDREDSPEQAERFFVDELQKQTVARVRQATQTANWRTSANEVQQVQEEGDQEMSDKSTQPETIQPIHQTESAGAEDSALSTESQPIPQAELNQEDQISTAVPSDTENERSGESNSEELTTWVERLSEAEKRLEGEGEEALGEGTASPSEEVPSELTEATTPTDNDLSENVEELSSTEESEGSLQDRLAQAERHLTGDEEKVVVIGEAGSDEMKMDFAVETEQTHQSVSADAHDGESVPLERVEMWESQESTVELGQKDGTDSEGDGEVLKGLGLNEQNVPGEDEEAAESDKPDDENDENYPALRSLLQQMAQENEPIEAKEGSDADSPQQKGPSWR